MIAIIESSIIECPSVYFKILLGDYRIGKVFHGIIPSLLTKIGGSNVVDNPKYSIGEIPFIEGASEMPTHVLWMQSAQRFPIVR